MQKCPKCQSKDIKKNGLTRLNYQRYRCKVCGKSFSDNPQGLGRPRISHEPMAAAERMRNYRKRKNRC